MAGVYASPHALFRAEMAVLAHAAWILVPLALAAGVLALVQYLRRSPPGTGRYLHATLVLLLWLVFAGAFYYVHRHPAYAVGSPAGLWLDAAGLALLGGSSVGLVLRHAAMGPGRTARTILLHWFFAGATSVLLTVALWPYR